MAHDVDSAIGDIDFATDTPAAGEAFQHGRENQCMLYVEPNELLSIESLYHEEHVLDVFYRTFKWFYRSPNEHPGCILDIGTGGGAWPLTIGDLCPQAAVYAVDTTLIQSAWTSPSVEFCCLECWECLNDEPSNKYDLVRIGNFTGAWSILVQNLRRILKPGGYVEYHQIEFENGQIRQLFNKVDRTFNLHKAGFESVDVRTEKIDISGEERFEYLVSLYEVLVLRKLSNAWNWIEIAVQRALARKIIKRYGTEGYIRCSSIFAQKAKS